ncbi:dienelactone hydrolase family protein [Neofusicoccum parvum]|nr:dienelactone hydrolase family protein [Neofusicoccum parvum]
MTNTKPTTPPPCCLTGTPHPGTPVGRTGTLSSNRAYITGTNPRAAILLIHDLLGWTFPNTRLLADHYAQHASATVFVPDFFDGAALPAAPLLAGPAHWGPELDVAGFVARNAREVREPEVVACARALRAEAGFERVAAVGFCYGGWAVFRLGAREWGDERLVDCVCAGHPSLLTEADVDGVGVPVQVLAPEVDPAFTAELKRYTFGRLMELGVPFDWQHFPGVEHACLVRGDPERVGEREAMVRGRNAAVAWLRQWLHDE